MKDASARLLVAVDGSEASAAALACAAAQVRCEGRSLTGVFVVDTGWADYIGNDWQSAAGARQGFLDYVRADQERHAAAARRQFEEATAGLADCRFEVLAGDPAECLVARMADSDAAALVLGRETFAVCGRPSVKRLPQTLAAKLGAALQLV